MAPSSCIRSPSPVQLYGTISLERYTLYFMRIEVDRLIGPGLPSRRGPALSIEHGRDGSIVAAPASAPPPAPARYRAGCAARRARAAGRSPCASGTGSKLRNVPTVGAVSYT